MILTGDALTMLRTLPDESAQCCVTSPPYYGLRDYGTEGQIGLESTPEEYIARLVDVFREVRRVLKSDGTLWVNIGDSYAGSGKGANPDGTPHPARLLGKQGTNTGTVTGINKPNKAHEIGLKPKDLIGIPWTLAFALRADGWYLRQDIIWSKPNPMPESVRDRCTKAHEYIFLLSKSQRYYYDADAVSEPVAESTVTRLSQPTLETQAGNDRVQGKTDGPMKAVGRGGRTAFRGQGQPRDAEGGKANRDGRDMKNVGVRFGGSKYGDSDETAHRTKSGNEYVLQPTRNRRSVWNITTKPYKGAHFATFPPELPEICIKAGTREGDTVLDPFGGSGTTAWVAERMNRRAITIELNPEYVREHIEPRLADVTPLFCAGRV